MSGVTELVILGRSTETMKQKVVVHKISDYGDEADRFEYRPWPQLPFAISFHEDLLKLEKEGDRLVENYDQLLCTLHNLPKLSKLSYAGTVSGPGFCQVSDGVVDDHAARFSQAGLSVIENPEISHGWSDSEMVTMLLGAGFFRWTSLRFSQPLPICNGIKLGRLWRRDPLRVVPQRQIEEISFTVPGHDEWKNWCESLMRQAVGLKRLEFVVSSGIDDVWGNVEARARDPLNYVWTEGLDTQYLPWPLSTADHLTSLTITCTSRVPDPFNAEPIIDFIKKCVGTLQNVRLDNVFFSHNELLDEVTNVGMSTLAVLRVLKSLQISRPDACIRWTIRRLKCTDSCQSPQVEHDEDCERYSAVMYDAFDPFDQWWDFFEGDMEALAVELGAPETGGLWELGQSDMLAVAMQD
ncbi:hypothetical protein LTR27_000835 [Elasticomyces elasticus]|nr:hypothetical protein LTR27_000835 [Elasticomyces elasticus]